MFGDDILNYLIFVQSLIEEYNNLLPKFFLERIRVYYYDAMLEEENPKTEQQRLYFKTIINIAGFEDRLGNIKKAKKERNRQKGVDSLIAVDMISKAYQDHYDSALLIAGDGIIYRW